MLVSFNGAQPEPLPFRLRLPNGTTRTSLYELPLAELVPLLAEVGYVIVSDPQPGQVWNGSAWRDKTVEELAAEAAAFAVQRMAEVQSAVQTRLDLFAQERHYDGILSLCTYTNSAVPAFAAEGQRGVALRDSTWAACYAILADVTNNVRPLPTVEQVLAELPALTWA
jgi:hypothetical protein